MNKGNAVSIGANEVTRGFVVGEQAGGDQMWISLDEQVRPYWDHLCTLPRASVTVNNTKGDVFHDVTIEGYRFRGKVFTGGEVVIVNLTAPLFFEENAVALGAASIRPCAVDKLGVATEWWICKYSSKEPRLDLGNMTEEGRNALAFEFGLPIVPKEGRTDPKLNWSIFVNGREANLFYLSPAFTKLVQWAKCHSRKARSSSKNAYHLKRWMDRAIEHSSFN